MLSILVAICMYKIVQSINVFEIALPIFTISHMGPSVEGVLPICSNGSALFNKMAAMPILVKKTLTNLLL